jgi:hypothetical protein
MKKNKQQFEKAYVVAVDMGYGHQRAVYPLKDIAASVDAISVVGDGIINANHYAGIPHSDERKWGAGRGVYESISRMKHLPLIGEAIFGAMDYFQRIKPFYPARDLTKPTAQLKTIYRWIHQGWGRDLIEKLNKNPLPFISSFFTPAYFADEHGYKGDIYMMVCDADMSRAWAPLNPEKSKIQYLVPNRRVEERLQLYGVKKEKIFITGFPLPKENIGGPKLQILRKSLGHRINHLDPENKYHVKFKDTIHEFIGESYCTKCVTKHPLTITFAVGGAGAQRELGVVILESLKEFIKDKKILLNLVAGVNNDVYLYYQKVVQDMGLNGKQDGVHIMYAETKTDYFRKFNELLLDTDILWTKPSELSFYAGLGIPIIMAPTVGSQEEFNKAWLQSIGAGVPQEDPRYVCEWLFDWLQSGWLAQAAMNGFMNAPRMGAYHIEDVVLRGKRSEIEDIHLL